MELQQQAKHPEVDTDTPENQNAPETGAEQSSDTAQDNTADWKAKYDELYSQYLRLAADFDNFRKRQAQEMQASKLHGLEKAAGDLLPFLDNLDRATRSLNENSDAKMLYQSFSLVKQQLLDTLGNMGVKRMTTIGQPFDPKIHEAVAQVPVPNQPDNTIIEEQQSGYMLKDRVLRVAQVVVAIQPEGAEAQGQPAAHSAPRGDSGNNPFAQVPKE